MSLRQPNHRSGRTGLHGSAGSRECGSGCGYGVGDRWGFLDTAIYPCMHPIRQTPPRPCACASSIPSYTLSRSISLSLSLPFSYLPSPPPPPDRQCPFIPARALPGRLVPLLPLFAPSFFFLGVKIYRREGHFFECGSIDIRRLRTLIVDRDWGS